MHEQDLQYTIETIGTCVVCITCANRSLVAYPAATNLFAKDHLEVPENLALLEKAQVFYTASFSLTAEAVAYSKLAGGPGSKQIGGAPPILIINTKHN